jgi:hypothetical protein
MARGLAIAMLLLVAVAATTTQLACAVKLQADDSPAAAEEPAGAPAAAEGPDGPAFVEFVIKHPYPAKSLGGSRSADGLPVDPTPDGLPVDPTPDGLPVDPTPDGLPVDPTPDGQSP